MKLFAAAVLSALLAYAAYGTYIHASSDLCAADADAFRCTDFVEAASRWSFWALLLVFAALFLVSNYRLWRWAKRQRRFR